MSVLPWPLPEGWRWVQFSDVARVASDLVDPAEFPDVPHIAPNHIESETGRLLPYSTIRADGVTSPKHRFRRGQVLYSKIRPYLAKVVVADFDGLCSADMYPIDTELEPRLLKWWMLTREFTRRAAGEQARTVLPKINVRALSKLPVPLPPPWEQRRIVEILEDHLSRLDAARQAVETAAARASTLVAANAREALQAASGEATTLGAVAHSVRNGIFVSRPGRDPDGVPILRISAVRPLRLDTEDIRYSGRSVAELSDAGALLTEGDLLFTRYNGNVELVGACAVVPDRNSAMTYPDKLIRVSVDRRRAHPSYVALACTFGAGRQQIRSCVKTTAGQAGVSGKDLKAVRLTLPDVAEQARVAARFDGDIAAVRRLQGELAAALGREAALRRAILEAAFSGSLTTSTTTAEAPI